ncbi:MAG: ATP-binding protein [Actinomycetota bacterium]
MDIIFTLCLPRDEASVPLVRHVCRNSMQALGVATGCIDEVELAVTEACTNVLKHVEGTDEEYEISVEIADALCQIRIVDREGDEGFDHTAQGLRQAEARAESGRGIFLMRAMVDELNFSAEPEVGTIVQLVKKLELDDGSVLRALAVG